MKYLITPLIVLACYLAGGLTYVLLSLALGDLPDVLDHDAFTMIWMGAVIGFLWGYFYDSI